MTLLRMALPLVGALVATQTASAQRTAGGTDPRWHAFLGCWVTSAPGYSGPTVCVVPTDTASQVELIAVANDSIVSRTTVTADGRRHRVSREGCDGVETATWSQDDRRLFTRAEFTCRGGATQVATGMYSMNHSNAFTRIEGVKTRGASRARVVSFQWVDTVRVPDQVAARVPDLSGMRIAALRVEASAALTTADVLEATAAVEPDVVEAWVADRGQSFEIKARDLRALRDAKVPTNVIDMMVAVSYPKVFTVQPGNAPDVRVMQAAQGALNSSDLFALQRDMRLRSALRYGFGDFFFPFASYDPFFSPVFGNFLTPWAGWNNPYLYNPFFFNGAYLYGWPGYNLGGGFIYPGNTFVGNGPYVIAPAQPTRTDPPGRVINGLGYSASGGSGGGTAQPSPSVSNGGGYSSGGGGGYSGASSGGASSGASGGGEQRTAKPRP